MRRNSRGGIVRLVRRGGGPSSPGRWASCAETPLEAAAGDSAERIPPDRGRVQAPIVEWERLLDIAIAALVLVALSPVIVLVALAIKLDSRGPVLFRCTRVGRGGRHLGMLKFRKMRVGVSGPPLTAANDDRFTRIGRLLARTKLDEIPQFWNVLRGEMSLVGPRPEDPRIVCLHREEFAKILRVRPGITGLSQLAFANEAQILAVDDRLHDYLERILPQKMRLDRLYVDRSSLPMYLQILAWTFAAVCLGKQVAVHRSTGRLTVRAPRAHQAASVLVDSARSG